MIRHLFAGVNSPKGFFSRFDRIAPDKECKKKVYIKGGPGTGKSTLMKTLADKAAEEGYDVELFHCSSDSDSIDGVFIPDLKSAVVDATPPHNCDPQFPGINGEIFNAAEFINSDKLHKNSSEIFELTTLKRNAFGKTYNYLSAAAYVLADINEIYRRSMLERGIELESFRAISKYIPDILMPKQTKIRRLFASAICPDGFVNYLDTIFKGLCTVTVKGHYGAHILLKKIAETAAERGFLVEAFFCPMFPAYKTEHVIIKDLKVAFTTYNHYHHFQGSEVIDLDEYMKEIPEKTDEAWTTVGTLLNQAIYALTEAKAAHRIIESYYISSMDFDTMKEKSNRLISDILNS